MEKIKPSVTSELPQQLAQPEIQITPRENPFGIDVDSILSLPDPKRFWDSYSIATNYERKYTIARALIHDGRILNSDWATDAGHSPVEILSKFAQFKSKISDEQAEQVHNMRQELYVLLTGNGVKVPDLTYSLNEEEEKVVIERLIMQDPDLQQLVGIVELPILGAIANAVLFQHLSDAKKEENMRATTTRALIRPYLGNVIVHRGDRTQGGFLQLIQRLPDKIFKDPTSITEHIALNFVENEVLKLFNGSDDEGMQELEKTIITEENPVKKMYLEKLHKRIEKVKADPISSDFRTTIRGVYEGRDLPFPHMRQRYIVNEFTRPERNIYAKQNRLLLHGGTGSGKTATAYLAMEAAGAKKTVIFGPANARDTWPHEAKKIFTDEALQNSKKVFTVKEIDDINSPEFLEASHVYLGSQMLGRYFGKPEFKQIMDLVVEARGSDGIIIDEAHNFRNYYENEESKSSKALVELIRAIEANQKKKTKEGEEQKTVPIIALTATPFVSEVQDYDILMNILYPEEYGLKTTDPKQRFSTKCAKDPHVIFTNLIGNRLMISVSTRDIFGDKVPEYSYDTVSLQMGSFERSLYEWIHNQDMSVFHFMNVLRGTTFEPNIAVESLLKNNIKPPILPKDDVLLQLTSYYKMWQEEGNNQQFDYDWITEHGGSDILLSALFDREHFPTGLYSAIQQLDTEKELQKYTSQIELQHLEELIQIEDPSEEIIKEFEQKTNKKITNYGEILESLQQLKEIWNFEHPVPISAKYKWLYHHIQDEFVNIDGDPQSKLFIVSPSHKEGITTSKNYFSLVELIELWTEGCENRNIFHIDGEVPFHKRRALSEKWRNNGESHIAVTVMDAVFESLDFAVRDTEDNKHIDNINIVLLGLDWDHRSLEQLFGRYFRPGMDTDKNVQCYILHTEGTIDEGMSQTVERRRLLNLMTTYGVQLTDEEKKFMDGTEKKVVGSEASRKQAHLRWVMQRLKGMGEKAGLDYLSLEAQKDKTGFEQFIELYFDDEKDVDRIVGNNARLVSSILANNDRRNVLSIGAGSCLLSRTANQNGSAAQFTNVDMNHASMFAMHSKFPDIATFAVGKASSLKSVYDVNNRSEKNLEDGSFDAVDMSFMLDWTKNEDTETGNERAKVLAEAHRLLSNDGNLIITLPESSFKEVADFIQFTNALSTYFGFEVVPTESGQTFTKDLKPNRRIGWSLSLRKTGDLHLSGLTAQDLVLSSDPQPFVSTKSGTKIDKPVQTVRTNLDPFHATEFDIRNIFLPSELEKTNTDEAEFVDIEPESPLSYTPLPEQESQNGHVEATISKNVWDSIVTLNDRKGTVIEMKKINPVLKKLSHRFDSDEELLVRAIDIIEQSEIPVKKLQDGQEVVDYRYLALLIDWQTSLTHTLDSRQFQYIKLNVGRKWDQYRRNIEKELKLTYEEAEWLLAGCFADLESYIDSQPHVFSGKDLEREEVKAVTKRIQDYKNLKEINIL